MRRRFAINLVLLLSCLAMPFLATAQLPWKRVIDLEDRRGSGKNPVVAKAYLSAYYMNSRLAPGERLTMRPDGSSPAINFPKQKEGFVKFKIDKIEWVDKDFDKSVDYKVVVRSLWVDMTPKLWTEARIPGKSKDQLRRLYINAPNVEYVNGDATPPPFIFKLDRNDSYAFTLGFKVLTPKTKQEKPFPHTFKFGVNGLLRGKVEAPKEEVKKIEKPLVVEVEEPKKDEKKADDNTAEIDAAVARAIEEEDVDGLMELMKLYPGYQSVKDARGVLGIYMTRELIDSMTYRIDIGYKRFSRSLPRRDQLSIDFAVGGRTLTGAERPYHTWRGDKLFVTPPRDTIDYTLIATLRAAPENKAKIALNSVKDFINFSYADTLEDAFVTIHISGGKSPFALHLEEKKAEDFFEVDGSIQIFGDTVIEKLKLARAFRLTEEGDFRMFVEDSEQLKKTGRGTVHLIPPPPIPPEVWYGSLAGLILLLIGFRVYRNQQKKKDEEMERLIEARGGLDPKVKRKPKPELTRFWKETAISDLSLHKSFIDEIATYLKERPHFPPGSKPILEGVILGTVLKFDFENEQYEVRLDRFRGVEPKPLDHYDDLSDKEKWPEIREVTEDHPDLVKIGWLQVVEEQPMELGQAELQFQDEQFSELFQLLLKIDIKGGVNLCGFFTRTVSGKINNEDDRAEKVTGWMDWDRLENAGYYENEVKPVRQASETLSVKNVNNPTEWA